MRQQNPHDKIKRKHLPFEIFDTPVVRDFNIEFRIKTFKSDESLSRIRQHWVGAGAKDVVIQEKWQWWRPFTKKCRITGKIAVVPQQLQSLKKTFQNI